MGSEQSVGSAVAEAERALQVVNVLQRMERRIDQGHWQRGRRFGPGGNACLVGVLDESAEWAMPEVKTEVTQELVAHLPASLRIVAQCSPRVALMTYNDAPGGQQRARKLIADALERLGIRPASAEPFTGRRSHPSDPSMRETSRGKSPDRPAAES